MKRSLTLAVVLMLLGITIYAQENAVKIGEQVWMKYDLDVVRFINGDPLLEAKTIDEFSAAGDEQKPACYKTATGTYFYNWYAVNDKRGLAPSGWSIASTAEWQKLVDFLGGKEQAYVKIESLGFNIDMIGMISYLGLDFVDLASMWWSSTAFDDTSARVTMFALGNLQPEAAPTEFKWGLLVRCVKIQGK